ncbi:class I SAM-dependent methyltransferase [Ectobacillus ponti]|uniref:Class I SAM-dependent methyltransferase n=1 Tax=Ectobacillus ponti TaxID=2961894 RepID=A0AA42BTM7_9BACI|nr:class I SAM-dependent methyltransferase [Ectobacillus ponti]MCP8969643.1 class I SAM-dependent methyltransferase [Ectobacillus ponti]
MGIDFFAEENKGTYAARAADQTWLQLMAERASVQGKIAVDIGCGGGIYSRALIGLGAAQVIGVDFSAEMLAGAAAFCRDEERILFRQGSAAETGLPAACCDVVLERALTHHLPAEKLPACFVEAHRILRRGGLLVVQNRTPEDCLRPGSSTHLRGYFFQLFPRLIAKETGRRHSSMTMRQALGTAGFADVEEVKLWETRRTYADQKELERDLLGRTGRSILHELTDDELRELASYICARVPKQQIQENDCWTIWLARKG